MIKCASCVQAHALQETTEKRDREAASASREAALQARVAKRVAAAHADADAARKTKCPWCGRSEEHDEYAYAVYGRNIASFAEPDAWLEANAKWLPRLAILLDAKHIPSDCIYPYCSKKCRYDAKEVGELDELADMAELLEFRSAALQEVEAAMKLVPKYRAQLAASQAQSAARAKEFESKSRQALHRWRFWGAVLSILTAVPLTIEMGPLAIPVIFVAYLFFVGIVIN